MLRAEMLPDVDVQNRQAANDEIGMLVTAVAAVLQQTVASLDQTVSRITEMTVMRESGADRDLIVALQDFDLLQQEFATLGELLARLPGTVSGSSVSPDNAAVHPLLAGIAIAGLKDRLSRQLSEIASGIPVMDGEDEAEF